VDWSRLCSSCNQCRSSSCKRSNDRSKL